MRVPRLERPQADLGIEAHADFVEGCVLHVDEVDVAVGVGLALLAADVFHVGFGGWRGRWCGCW